MSELCVRTDIDVLMYNLELADICREKGARLVRSSVTLRDLANDGLHLLLDGRELFAEDIHKAITNLTFATVKGQLPQSMVPPIRGKGKKKKENEKEHGNTRRHINRFGSSKKLKRLSRHQFQVFGGDGYQTIGFRSPPVPKDLVPQLPIPTYQSVSRVIKAAPSLSVPSPSTYVKGKKKAKKKKKRLKRVRKRRARRKRQQVSSTIKLIRSS